MGCSASTPAEPIKQEASTKLLPKESSQSRSAPKPAVKQEQKPPENKPAVPSTANPFNRAKDRVDAIDKTARIEIDGIKMRYAYLSQRGFYPDDPFKANQDAYAVHPQLSSTHGDALFAVFDGHGSDGDKCAQYTKKNYPRQLEANLKKTKDRHELHREQLHRLVTQSHVQTNKGLHADSKVDDSLSGTTAISVYFHGKRQRMTIANVGDSRAVLGQRDRRGVLKALPLSRDQTPYRKDERARIRATGARIMSIDQLEGLEPIKDASENEEDFELGEELDEDGDPPRVWAPDGDYPGTAFTRSIGDAMAEELGVYAEPEMLSRQIVPEDKMIVLASDGVFEFLTNQSVIDICAKFADPLEACRAVVAEAYELWLQYELRTDDITIIVMFLDDVPTYKSTRRLDVAMNQSSHSDDEEEMVMTTEGLRPVRKNVSKEKSKAIEKMKSTHHTVVQAEEPFDFHKLASDKSPEEKAAIAEAIKASVMFRNITDEQRDMIFACMESVPVKQGTWVIRQGTQGDRFYIIDEGFFEVRIVPDGEVDASGQGGHIVHIYEGSRVKHAHPSFGELALMYSAPRSASIVAKSDGHLWALHRSAFRQVLMMQSQDNRQELKKRLTEIPYFQYLDTDGINKLAAIMDEITFGRGENITNQGQIGEKLYVIQSGQCYSVKMEQTGTNRSNLNKGQHFGEEVLEGDGRYTATVMALQTTNCWQLDVNVLKKTMGPLLQGLASN